MPQSNRGIGYIADAGPVEVVREMSDQGEYVGVQAAAIALRALNDRMHLAALEKGYSRLKSMHFVLFEDVPAGNSFVSL